jgi:predicted enzyme related to lactoylglutathione lyase
MDPVTHFELPANDRKRASNFYKTTFGWMLNETPGMDYTIVLTANSDPQTGQSKQAGAINGGIGPKRGPLTAPVVTIHVADIEAALAKVSKNGGKVVQRKEKVGDFGFSGYFQDTEGNTVGLWQPAGPR